MTHDREHQRARIRAREQARRDELRAAGLPTARGDPEKRRARQRAYDATRKEKRRVSDKARHARNREADAARRREWLRANPDKAAAYRENSYEYRREWKKEKYRTDPIYRLVQCARARIRLAAISQSTKKTAKTYDLLGCTGAQLYAYLLTKLQPGMTADDLMSDRIHLDHIRPCAAFDLTDPEQQRACFHYTNMQPLWAHDNLRKHSKLDDVRITKKTRDYTICGTVTGSGQVDIG